MPTLKIPTLPHEARMEVAVKLHGILSFEQSGFTVAPANYGEDPGYFFSIPKGAMAGTRAASIAMSALALQISQIIKAPVLGGQGEGQLLRYNQHGLDMRGFYLTGDQGRTLLQEYRKYEAEKKQASHSQQHQTSTSRVLPVVAPNVPGSRHQEHQEAIRQKMEPSKREERVREIAEIAVRKGEIAQRRAGVDPEQSRERAQYEEQKRRGFRK